MPHTVLVPVLIDTVAHVLGVRADKKVIRIYARTNIAFVANKVAFRDFTLVHLVRCTVSIEDGSSCTAELELTISGW